ncbi:MAG: hypothetical protein JW854_17285 [Actinobacteria bacterium]|nr:hypothetical protein [Actinomycetota bacterium]
MIPVYRVLIAVLFGGMAAWFLRYRYDRKEPSVWFFVWLVASALNYALSAAAYWVKDMTISQSLCAASFTVLSISLFLIFGFARSFTVDASHLLFYWSVPLMFSMALTIMYPEALFVRSGDIWVLKKLNAATGVYIAIGALYAMLAVYYIGVLYRTLRSHGQKKEMKNTLYILAGLLLLFITAAVGGWLKASTDPGIPVVEIGNLIGALMIVWGVTGPMTAFTARKAEGER